MYQLYLQRKSHKCRARTTLYHTQVMGLNRFVQPHVVFSNCELLCVTLSVIDVSFSFILRMDQMNTFLWKESLVEMNRHSVDCTPQPLYIPLMKPHLYSLDLNFYLDLLQLHKLMNIISLNRWKKVTGSSSWPRSAQKNVWAQPWPIQPLSTQFHGNLSISICVILRNNGRTNKPKSKPHW